MELQVQKREKFGKQTGILRAQGLIPAELYGKGVKNEHLSVLAKDFRKVLKEAGENTLFNVMLDNQKKPVMIANVSVHPVTDEILSVDFNQVRLDEKVRVKVPVEFIGEAPAIKEKNGVLVKAMQELEVEALPGDVPRSIVIDLSKLADIGQGIYVKDVAGMAGVKFIADPDSAIVTVIAQMTEEQEAAKYAEVKPEEVKVETEEKKAERAAEKAATAPEGAAPAAEAPAAKPAAEKK